MENEQRKGIHFGFAILKCFLSFKVITSHCFKRQSSKNKVILFITGKRRLHVPSFTIMSFYFNHNTLISNDSKKKMNRFERLLIPYLGWPIIMFVFNNIFKYTKEQQKLFTIKKLIFQLITGQGQSLFHFWYLFDLIATTFIFHIIIIAFRNKYLLILNIMLFFSYYLQYSRFSEIIIRHSKNIQGLARENEIIPFAITGFTLNSFKIFNKLEKYKLNTLIISSLIFYLTQDFEIFRKFSGVAYNGVKLNILSLCLIIIFSFFSFRNIKNKKLMNLLKYSTCFSGGVYYLHQVIHFYFKSFFTDIKNGTFSGLILNYFISYLISLAGGIIFRNNKVKNLFS